MDKLKNDEIRSAVRQNYGKVAAKKIIFNCQLFPSTPKMPV